MDFDWVAYGSGKVRQELQAPVVEPFATKSEEVLGFKGGAKSERMKVVILFGKGPSMVRIALGGSMFGTDFLIHWNLLLITHVNLPSVATVESAEIRLQYICKWEQSMSDMFHHL